MNFVKIFMLASLLGAFLTNCSGEQIERRALSGAQSTPNSADHLLSCQVGDQVYSPGTTYTAEDSCNTCTCTNGISACSKKTCDDPSSPESIANSCEVDGQTYESGTTFAAPDGCNSCFCTNGASACTEMACPDKVEVVELSVSLDRGSYEKKVHQNEAGESQEYIDGAQYIYNDRIVDKEPDVTMNYNSDADTVEFLLFHKPGVLLTDTQVKRVLPKEDVDDLLVSARIIQDLQQETIDSALQKLDAFNKYSLEFSPYESFAFNDSNALKINRLDDLIANAADIGLEPDLQTKLNQIKAFKIDMKTKYYPMIAAGGSEKLSTLLAKIVSGLTDDGQPMTEEIFDQKWRFSHFTLENNRLGYFFDSLDPDSQGAKLFATRLLSESDDDLEVRMLGSLAGLPSQCGYSTVLESAIAQAKHKTLKAEDAARLVVIQAFLNSLDNNSSRGNSLLTNPDLNSYRALKLATQPESSSTRVAGSPWGIDLENKKFYLYSFTDVVTPCPNLSPNNIVKDFNDTQLNSIKALFSSAEVESSDDNSQEMRFYTSDDYEVSKRLDFSKLLNDIKEILK